MELYDFSELTGFEWDEANEHKNHIKHHVTKNECEQIFFNEPLLFFEDEKHSINEKRYYVLGQTNDFRELFIVFTIRNDHIRVISARDMNRKERLIYESQKITQI